MVTLDDIHFEEFSMLLFLDSICKKRDSNYSIIGGTMLGAVRHKGFVPWDDDIDVFMNIKDFNKIKDELSDPKYFVQTPESDIEMPFPMYKLRRNNSVMPEKGMEGLSIHQGIWLDIFIYTNGGKTVFQRRLQNFIYLLLKSYRCRYLNKDRLLFRILKALPRRFQLSIDDFLIKCICLLGSKKSNVIFALDVGDYVFYPKKYFQESSMYEFEGRLFSGPKDYDGYLSMIYGDDYMTPRKWKHIQNYENVVIN